MPFGAFAEEELGKPKPLVDLLPAKKGQCRPLFGTGYIRVGRYHDTDVIEYFEGDELLGQIKTDIPTNGINSVWINWVQVKESAQGRGISTRLFEKVAELSGPGLIEVGGQLAYSNYEATVKEYLAVSTPGSPRYLPGLTTEQISALAVQASPFVKAWSKLGFTKVKNATVEWTTVNGPPYVSQILVTLEKPH